MNLLAFLLLTFVFWFLFATLMRIRDWRERYSRRDWQYWALSVPGYFLLVVGYPYDILYNLTWGSIIFMELPRRGEWTFTARLQRLVQAPAGRRGRLARFICRYLVEPWDDGHCGMGRYP